MAQRRCHASTTGGAMLKEDLLEPRSDVCVAEHVLELVFVLAIRENYIHEIRTV